MSDGLCLDKASEEKDAVCFVLRGADRIRLEVTATSSLTSSLRSPPSNTLPLQWACSSHVVLFHSRASMLSIHNTGTNFGDTILVHYHPCCHLDRTLRVLRLRMDLAPHE